MTTVLIALDETDESHNAARVAHDMFGDAAQYLAINVAESPTSAEMYAWGSVYGYPYPAVVPAAPDPEFSEDLRDSAREAAADLAGDAGLEAVAIGDVGDPVDAICRAAVEHNVDVIVAGWHDRSWMRRMFEGSITNELLKQSSVPVLVVPTHEKH